MRYEQQQKNAVQVRNVCPGIAFVYAGRFKSQNKKQEEIWS
jgi:hypothetical protein